MKLEITFQGKTRNRDAFIRSVQRLAKAQEYQLGAWKDGMRVVLCPLGYLDMGWTRESGLFGGWKITGGCITVPGGPGLHKAVVELIDALSKKDLKEVQVVDSTGFWEHRDFQRLSQETYGPWLEQELRGALVKLGQSPESVPLFWGEEDYLPQEVPDTVYTHGPLLQGVAPGAAGPGPDGGAGPADFPVAQRIQGRLLLSERGHEAHVAGLLLCALGPALLG